MDQHRHRDVVGQVGDQGRGRRPGKLGDAERVGCDDLEPVDGVRRPLGDGRREPRRQPFVDLDGHDMDADVEEREGQRTQAGSDLDDDVAGDARAHGRCAARCWRR